MSNLVDKAIELQVMTCLDSLLDRANHDEYLGRIGKKEALKFLEENRQYAEIIKLRLHRLESIDNANPSEALECVEEWKYQINSYIDCSLDCGDIDNECYNHLMDELEQYYNTIKQALIKSQEPKQYLKWEDLEFSEERQTIKVLLNGEKYFVKYKKEYLFGYYEKVEITNGTFILCTLGSAMKHFFNDLRLERVEE